MANGKRKIMEYKTSDEVNMPRINDEERCDTSGFTYKLTLLNKMSERERGGG